jgi:hypothetical protein
MTLPQTAFLCVVKTKDADIAVSSCASGAVMGTTIQS